MVWPSTPATASSTWWMYPLNGCACAIRLYKLTHFCLKFKYKIKHSNPMIWVLHLWYMSIILSHCCWVFLNRVQVDNTGMLEFEEFKVFWEKLKKWIVSYRIIHLLASLSSTTIFQNITIYLRMKLPQRNCEVVLCAVVDAVPGLRYGPLWTHVILRAAQCS